MSSDHHDNEPHAFKAIAPELLKSFHTQFAENQRTKEQSFLQFAGFIVAMGVPFEVAALESVKAYNAFTSATDPYGEHDFGIFEIDEELLAWKIDYYDLSLRFGSQDPADPSQTKRVLTIMLEEES